MFTDTDSLCYEIKTADIHKDLFLDKDFLIILITPKTVSSFLMKIRR